MGFPEIDENKIDKLTTTINKKPLAVVVLIAILLTFFAFKWGQSQNEILVNDLRKQNDDCRDKFDNLNLQLLIKNNIISFQRDTIQHKRDEIKQIDSTIYEQFKNSQK